MSVRRISLILICLISSAVLYGADVRRLRFNLELSQMLSLDFGIEYNFNNRWGMRSSLGSGLPPQGTFTWNMMGFRRLLSHEKKWRLDLEGGVLLAYFNFFEGNVIDLDPMIKGPYHGYIPGIAFLMGRETRLGLFALRLGGGIWFEHQSDTGWKSPRLMPVAAFLYGFP